MRTIGATPPVRFRLFHAGVTWNGRIARRSLARRGAGVLHLIAGDEHARAGRPCGERRDAQAQACPLPAHGGNRQIALLEPGARLDVRPGDESPLHPQEGVERERLDVELERAVLAEESLALVAVRTDHCPVRLLPE